EGGQAPCCAAGCPGLPHRFGCQRGFRQARDIRNRLSWEVSRSIEPEGRRNLGFQGLRANRRFRNGKNFERGPNKGQRQNAFHGSQPYVGSVYGAERRACSSSPEEVIVARSLIGFPDGLLTA